MGEKEKMMNGTAFSRTNQMVNDDWTTRGQRNENHLYLVSIYNLNFINNIKLIYSDTHTHKQTQKSVQTFLSPVNFAPRFKFSLFSQI